MGLRLKLGLYVVGFATLVFGIAGYGSMASERRILREQMQTRGVTLLRAFAVPCSVAMANNDISTLDNYVVQFAETSRQMSLEYLAVLDFSGKVLAHTTPGEFGKVYDDAFTRRAMAASQPLTRVVPRPHQQNEAPMMRIAVPVVTGLRWGTLEAGFDLRGVERAVAQSRDRLVLIGLLLGLGTAVLAYFVLSLMVIRPMVRMNRMAKRIGAGQMNARVSLPQRDEMGQLAGTLNRMASQIQEYTESLEVRVQERTAELAASNAQLEQLARTDPLTSLYNRRHFMEQLQFEIRRGLRSEHAFTLVLMDVDHFKAYNDTYGHPAGDALLRHLADVLRANLRGTDVVARYGGEEFIVLLLDTAPAEGVMTAQKLQQRIASTPLPQRQGQPGSQATVSVGVSYFPADSVDGRTLIDQADQALYHAKQAGRNRVTEWRELDTRAGPPDLWDGL